MAAEGEHLPELFFQQVGVVETAVGAGDVAELGGLPLGDTSPTVAPWTWQATRGASASMQVRIVP